MEQARKEFYTKGLAYQTMADITLYLNFNNTADYSSMPSSLNRFIEDIEDTFKQFMVELKETVNTAKDVKIPGHEKYKTEILQHLANGYRVKAIAKKLDRDCRTIERWIDKLQEELNAETLPALVAKALRKKIID